MNDKILEIVNKNAIDLGNRKQQTPLPVLKKQARSLIKTRDFYEVLIQGYERHGIGLITEIKLASPTESHLGDASQIAKRAAQYTQAGATAISLVTEKYFFHGDTAFIKKVKKVSVLPLLQKDFIVDPYQIYEAKLVGTDALLLIVKLLDTKQLKEFVALCLELGIEPVVEINDDEDLAKALQTKTKIIAVNARDLDTFTINIENALVLLQQIPQTYCALGFSGVQSSREVKQYKKAGAKGVLVGTSLMKAENIEKFIASLYASS